MNVVILVENFLSVEEEKELLDSIPPGKNLNRKKRRNRIWRYGEKVYPNDIISLEIPEVYKKLGRRLYQEGHLQREPKHVTVNEFEKGNSLPAHIDKEESGEVISVVSLLSPAEMVLTKEGEKDIHIILPERSLLQMKGTLRWEWEHQILPIKNLRYSIVFRV